MKLVVVSTASINEPHRAPYNLLASERGWKVVIVAPVSISIGPTSAKHCDPAPLDAHYDLRPLPLAFAHLGRVGWFKGLGRLLAKVRPDVIFIEEDPGSLTSLHAAAFAPYAKRVAFSVENILRFRFRDARAAVFGGRGREALRDTFVGSLIWAGGLTTSAIACISDEGLRVFRDGLHWTKPIAVVPLGTDTKRFAPLDEHARRSSLGLGGGFVLGYFGRLVPEKGAHLLVEALARLPADTRLLLDMFTNFQPGSYAASLLSLAERLGVRNRIVTIDVPHAEVPFYMNCCDAVVLPSLATERWKEQFGRVLPEAMACEVPVIGSRSGNIPNMIGNAGLLFDEGSVDGLVEAVLRLLHDAELRTTLGANGRARVLERFSVEAQAVSMKELFLRL